VLSTFDFAALLFVLAATIGVVNERYVGLPRPIALLLGALLISVLILAASSVLPIDLDHRARLRLSHADLPKVLLDGILALLLFAACLHVDLRELRKRALPILFLATVGVILTTALFGAGIWGILQLAGVTVPLVWCLVLGAILAPTDAVAVDQLLHSVRMPEELRALISGESLFNDGAAVVLFFATLAAATGSPEAIGHGQIVLRLLVACCGAALIGLVTGFIAARAMRRSIDPAIAVTISLALVLTTYRIAVWLDLSGPVAVVVCGLVFYNLGARPGETNPLRDQLKAFWTITDDLVNTLLFLVMGFEILAIAFSATGWLPILAAIPLALACRFASVALPMLIERPPAGGRWPAIGVLTWTGLRGGVSLALVLALPEGPYRDVLSAVCYGVVIFTVVVQGLSTPFIVRHLYRGRS